MCGLQVTSASYNGNLNLQQIKTRPLFREVSTLKIYYRKKTVDQTNIKTGLAEVTNLKDKLQVRGNTCRNFNMWILVLLFLS